MNLIFLQAIQDITTDNDFKDLQKYYFEEKEWEILKDYEQILEVNFYLLDIFVAHKFIRFLMHSSIS